jgi:SAM-dependent methyltransferase
MEISDPRRLVEEHFDALGAREWDRLDADLPARVSLEIHTRFLRRFVREGDHVLDIGAGPGRFTIQLASLGATVHVGDISRVQLDLNEGKVAEAGAADAVVAREVLDVCDLSSIQANSFDVVLAYGGVISYTFDRAPDAVAELARVAKPGGVVVGGVSSLAGAARAFLSAFEPTIDAVGLDPFSDFLVHGDQRAILVAGAHPTRLLTWATLERLLEDAGLVPTDASASQWLALGDPEPLAWLAADEQRWSMFLDWEERFCREPGTIDGGHHILFAARKP